MNSFVFLTFIYLMQASYVGAANTVPVFMLDYDQVMLHVQIEPNPFAKVTSAQFGNILHDSAKRSAGVIIFVEECFNAEHISTKDRDYGTPFKNLHSTLLANKEKVKYLPSVIEPYQKLKQIFPPKEDNVFSLAHHSKLQLQDNFKYMYIFFNDGVSETKADVLQRHDHFIKKVVDAVRQLKPGPVVAFYTGKSNPLFVKKVELIKAPPVDARKAGVYVESPRAVFRLFGVNMITQTRRAEFNVAPTISEETYTLHQLTSNIKFTEANLQWKFTFPQDRWILHNVSVLDDGEEVGFTTLNIEAPYNNSYYCPEPIIIYNTRDKSTITIHEIQIEPRVNGSGALYGFSEPVHCARYYSAGITASLMCTVMWLLILLYGAVSIYDVGSNDRFDDPNAEPMTHEMGHADA